MHGLGTLILANGEKFLGNFNDGRGNNLKFSSINNILNEFIQKNFCIFNI